jgi:hypothetical protein
MEVIFMTKDELTYEPLPKPEMKNLIRVRKTSKPSDTTDDERLIALCKYLNLGTKDRLKTSMYEYFDVNPKYVLEGTSPEAYVKEIEEFRKRCTPEMIIELDEQLNRVECDEGFYDEFCKKLDEQDEKIKNSYFKNAKFVAGLNNCLYWLLKKEDRTPNEFLIAWRKERIPDQRVWTERSDGEYRVLTDREADKACKEYLDESRDSWVQAVKEDQTDDSFEDWKTSVMNCDGRGNSLAGYDGEENEETVNGTTYYIYRTN